MRPTELSNAEPTMTSPKVSHANGLPEGGEEKESNPRRRRNKSPEEAPELTEEEKAEQ